MRKVSAKIYDKASREWITVEGRFHQWGLNFEESREAMVNFTVAIIELPGGRVVVTAPEDVHFLEEPK